MSFFSINHFLFRFLLGKPATKKYPFGPMQHIPKTRGHINIDIDKCIYCCICDKKCPTHAIHVDREGKTWTIDQHYCIACNACVEECPKKCLEMVVYYLPPDKKLEKKTHKKKEGSA